MFRCEFLVNRSTSCTDSAKFMGWNWHVKEGSQKDELKEEACEEKEQIDEPRSKQVEE